MSYHYATFGPDGLCVGITSSPTELPWPHPVDPGTLANDIYLNDGAILPRSLIALAVDRVLYLCDGADCPSFTGLPADASLHINGLDAATVAQHSPAIISVQTVGKYRSDTLSLRFDTLEQYRSEFADEIDTSAGQARLSIITEAPGQSAVYAAKLQEARDYLKGAEGPFFYVSSAADADEIIARADQCNAALALIEARRLSAKAAVRAATDIPAILAAADIDWSLGDEPA